MNSYISDKLRTETPHDGEPDEPRIIAHRSQPHRRIKNQTTTIQRASTLGNEPCSTNTCLRYHRRYHPTDGTGQCSERPINPTDGTSFAGRELTNHSTETIRHTSTLRDEPLNYGNVSAGSPRILPHWRYVGDRNKWQWNEQSTIWKRYFKRLCDPTDGADTNEETIVCSAKAHLWPQCGVDTVKNIELCTPVCTNASDNCSMFDHRHLFVILLTVVTMTNCMMRIAASNACSVGVGVAKLFIINCIFIVLVT